jgi:hypothetical protein
MRDLIEHIVEQIASYEPERLDWVRQYHLDWNDFILDPTELTDESLQNWLVETIIDHILKYGTLPIEDNDETISGTIAGFYIQDQIPQDDMLILNGYIRNIRLKKLIESFQK